MDQGPTGFIGLTRGIIAITLILILAIAIFHLVVFEPTNLHFAEQLLTLLAGAVTAITGFYFGVKATTAATPSTKSGVGHTGGSSVPKILDVKPVSGAANKFNVIGEGFGDQQGTVKFTDKDAGNDVTVTVSKWSDKQIEVDVLTELNVGTSVNAVVTNDNGISSKPYSFKNIK